MTRRELDERVRQFILMPGDEARAGDFEELALEIFRFQYRHNDFYRRYVAEYVDGKAEKIMSWRDIPFLPVSAFKESRVACFPLGETKAIFRTSGTTTGKRGELHLDDLSLYEISLKTCFKKYCLPGRERITMASIIPSFRCAPDSSLSYMVTSLFSAFGTNGSAWFFEDARLDYHGFCFFLERCVRNREPVMLFGTALGFLAFLEYGEERNLSWTSAPESRLMETGGSKGRRVKISRHMLHKRLSRYFGIPLTHCVNEYGMTEMGSQFYDTALRRTVFARSADLETEKESCHWTRTLVLDPLSGEEVEPGKEGILCHIDLSNVGSVLALETEDLGIRTKGGFDVVGRIPISEPRGCSLAAEEMLYA